jgi:stress response protein YsnF
MPFNRQHYERPSQSFIGTGDIEVPKSIEIPRDKEELLAEALANGELNTPGAIRKFAKSIGWQPDYLEAKRMSRSMEKRVAELVRRRALYAAANAMPYQEELAKTDVPAFKTLLQVAKVLDPGGVNVQTQVVVDKRDGGDNESAVRFNELMIERLAASTGARLALVKGNAVRHDPVPEAPPTPEEAHVGAEPEAEPEDLEETEVLEPEPGTPSE